MIPWRREEKWGLLTPRTCLIVFFCVLGSKKHIKPQNIGLKQLTANHKSNNQLEVRVIQTRRWSWKFILAYSPSSQWCREQYRVFVECLRVYAITAVSGLSSSLTGLDPPLSQLYRRARTISMTFAALFTHWISSAVSWNSDFPSQISLSHLS